MSNINDTLYIRCQHGCCRKTVNSLRLVNVKVGKKAKDKMEKINEIFGTLNKKYVRLAC